jgi:hypothetical protein
MTATIRLGRDRPPAARRFRIKPHADYDPMP